MSPVRIFWPEFIIIIIIIIFFCTLYNEKNYFSNRKHFLRFFKKRSHLKIEGNVGTAFDLSFLSLLIFSDPIEIRLGSVSVFNSKTFKTGFGFAIRQVYLRWGSFH